ncbi:ParB N-terminal domain-containing protein [uncultured Serinicoccus sp.]|uniref:ParB/RepB/Spo0J family partition protein n=1 Tax=uncultured Serinicoccus sp. TaxID=735514 RepID=UPI00261564A7|nr:ParB N-terminal domain-containing protein [uncultured Serinicoccus sp.]
MSTTTSTDTTTITEAAEADVRGWEAGRVYEVDPAALVIGTNVRTDTRESKEFSASVKARGVIEPITAWADQDGSLVVERGQRRALTAARVGTPSGTVPVRVIERPGETDRITDQLTENIHREGMHATEEHEAIEQLALLGVSAAQIAKRTAIKRGTVDTVLSVAGSATAKERMTGEGLTLEQAAAVAEFEDEPWAMATLEPHLRFGGYGITHVVQRLRDARAERDLVQAEAERLRQDEGLPALDVVDYPARWRDLALCDLVRAEDGQPVAEQDWPGVPGAAVAVSLDWDYPDTDDHTQSEDDGGADLEDDDAEDLDAREDERQAVQVLVPVWICTDPQAAGLVTPWDYRLSQRQDSGTGTGGGPVDEAAQAEAKRAQRRLVRENNTAWRSAETVRRQWLAQFVTRKTPPKGAEDLICHAVLTGPHWLKQAFESSHPRLRSMLRPTEDGAPLVSYLGGHAQARELADEPASAKAATMRALAAILTAWEDKTDVHTWRVPDEWDRRVMAALTGWGYEACDVEQLLTVTTDEGEDPAEDGTA